MIQYPMSITSLDTLMTPVTDCLDAGSLRALVSLRAPAQAQERVNWLAERANEGLLTGEEQAEYESCAMFSNFLGVLQTKARKKLKAQV
jgi:hypothetical protein